MEFALVDDELHQLEKNRSMLSGALEQVRGENCHIHCFSSGEAFLESYAPYRYDVVILDIFMGDAMNGVDLARRLRETDPDVALVFCTSSNEFAAESYEVGAGFYLKKPVTEEKIVHMLRRLDLERIHQNRTIPLPDGSHCLLKTILYTEYQNHCVTFCLEGNKAQSFRISHTAVTELLKPFPEFQIVGQGTIVNLTHVVKLNQEGFLMDNSHLLGVPRRRYKDLQAVYAQYHFQKMRREVSGA